MQPLQAPSFMLIAGEASGDLLAAELAAGLRGQLPSANCFGAGGVHMAAAGVTLVHEMSHLSVVGITDVLAKFLEFRRLMQKLVAVALKRQPDVIIGVDYGGFNMRFGHAIKEYVRTNPFSKWRPKLVQFVSPQVWASRPGRAQRLAADCDLLLSIFPFEKDWYAQRAPNLRVEFVGHPMVARFATVDDLLRFERDDLRFTPAAGLPPASGPQPHEVPPRPSIPNRPPQILLLPGSRKSELKRHLPPMLSALKVIQEQLPTAKFTMVVPYNFLVPIVSREIARRLPVIQLIGGAPTMGDAASMKRELLKRVAELAAAAATLADAKSMSRQLFPNFDLQIGNLSPALAQADLALAKTGTVTMECAFFGVPAVTFYKGSWLNYQIARHLITVKTLTMPNLLAGEEVYPELLQNDLTADNLARAGLDLLRNEVRRQKIKAQLARVIASLGQAGASERAAKAILSLLA